MKLVAISATVTTGNDRVGTLSRSGSTIESYAEDLTTRDSGYILRVPSTDLRRWRSHGYAGSPGAVPRGCSDAQRAQPVHERPPRGERARDADVGADPRRLGGREGRRVRVRPARHSAGKDQRRGGGRRADGVRGARAVGGDLERAVPP